MITEQEKYEFTDEAIKNFADLYYSLKKVHDRLIKEGYQITNNNIFPPIKSPPP